MPTTRKTKAKAVKKRAPVKRRPARPRAKTVRRRKTQAGEGVKDDAYDFLKKHKKAIITGLTITALIATGAGGVKGVSGARNRDMNNKLDKLSPVFGQQVAAYGNAYSKALDNVLN